MTFLCQLIDNESDIKFKKKVDVISPISGRVLPLEHCPDPLYAQRLFGEGFAIEPAGYQILAPFVAKVETLDAMGYQLRLRSKSGLLMQIQLGMDTHLMHGEGFKTLCKVNQMVAPGTPLLGFDSRKMKQHLNSSIATVTLLNSDKLTAIRLHQRQVIAGEDIAMSLYI